MRKLFVALLGLTLGITNADVPTAADNTAVPGKRVGAITAYSSLATLKALYGSANVQSCKVPGAEGETLDGAKLLTGTDRALEIIWVPEAVERRIEAVRLIGKAWTLDNGVRLGLTIEETEKINGKPFKVSGFGWDYGGYASFTDGLLGKGVSVRFSPTEAEYSGSISGEKQIPSSDTTLRAAHPLVAELTITFGTGQD